MQVIIWSLNNDSDRFPIRVLLERELYQPIPGTKYKVRFDKANISTKTQAHAHVVQKGNQLFAVNTDGTAHDRSHNTRIPNNVANYLRDCGYDIPTDNYLENMDLEDGEYYYQVLLEIPKSIWA